MHALDSWQEEMQSAYLYKIIAKQEKVASRQKLFSQLAHEAESQAGIWAAEAEKAGHQVPEVYLPTARTKIVAWLIKCFGAPNIKPVLAAIKIRGLSVYSNKRVA